MPDQLTDAQLLELYKNPQADLALLTSDEQSRLVRLTDTKSAAPPSSPQGDLGHYAGYKRIGDAVVGAVKGAYNHPIETMGGLGAAGAVAATAPVSVPAALAAAGLGGAGGAAIGMIRNALSGSEDSPTTATGVAGEMGKQGALNAAFEGIGALGQGGMSLARNLYQRALKPTKAVLESAPAFRTGGQVAAERELSETGLRERAAVGGAGGINKIRGRIEDVNQQIADRVSEADIAGRFVDPIQVAKRATDTKAQFANQVTPQRDLASIDQVIADFMSHPTFGTKGGAASLLSMPESQSMKQGTYRALKGKSYSGELKSAEVEAQKGLARGLKEEIAAGAPEVGPLNLEESQLLTLKKALQDRARTSGNADPLKLGESVLLAGIHPKRAALGLINRPSVLSRGSIGLNEASQFYDKMPVANAFRTALLSLLGQGGSE
jgi:hypothetical protein